MHLRSQTVTGSSNASSSVRPRSRSRSRTRKTMVATTVQQGAAAQQQTAAPMVGAQPPQGPPGGPGGVIVQPVNLPAPGGGVPGGGRGPPGGGGPPGGPPGPVAIGAPMAAAIPRGFIFETDPFKCDINPATPEGLKLFLKATAEFSREDRIDATQDSEKEFMKAIRTDAANFAWGRLVHRVQIDDLPTYKSLIKNYNEVTLLNVKQEALKTWGDKTSNIHTPFPNVMNMEVLDPIHDIGDRMIFFRRVRSRMIAKRLQGIISSDSWASLLQYEHEFSWESQNGDQEFDGPTMLKLLITSVNPSTRVGVDDIKKEIQNARLAKYNHDVKKMLDDMNRKYLDVLRQGHTHDSYMMHLFDALLTSKNDSFVGFIQRKKDDWEIGGTETPTTLISLAVQKYNNMKKQNTWNQTNPKDAKIMALTTKLQKLENQVACYAVSSGTHQDKSNAKGGKSSGGIDKWRMKNVGQSKTVNGVQYWWCPHHKLPGQFDGLYVQHKPSEHDDWKRKRDEKRAQWKEKKNKSGNKSKNVSASDGNKLQLTQKMKSALCTHFHCTEEDAEACFSDFAQDFQ